MHKRSSMHFDTESDVSQCSTPDLHISGALDSSSLQNISGGVRAPPSTPVDAPVAKKTICFDVNKVSV